MERDNRFHRSYQNNLIDCRTGMTLEYIDDWHIGIRHNDMNPMMADSMLNIHLHPNCHRNHFHHLNLKFDY